MSEKSKRPWFRFHLLTAVMVVLAAGGMLWMNLQKQFFSGTYHWLDEKHYPHSVLRMGFPFSYYTEDTDERMPWENNSPDWHLWGLIFDVLIALFVLIVLAYICEFLLRRREARKL